MLYDLTFLKTFSRAINKNSRFTIENQRSEANALGLLHKISLPRGKFHCSINNSHIAMFRTPLSPNPTNRTFDLIHPSITNHSLLCALIRADLLEPANVARINLRSRNAVSRTYIIYWLLCPTLVSTYGYYTRGVIEARFFIGDR